jgi:hypothetical protein
MPNAIWMVVTMATSFALAFAKPEYFAPWT